MKRTTPFLLLAFILSMHIMACGNSPTEEALLSEIEQHRSEEKLVEATKAMEKFVDLFPKSPRRPTMMKELAILYVGSAKDFRKAIEIYKKIQADYPEDANLVAQSQFMAGYIYANDLHEYENARKEYEEFLERFPNNDLADDVAWELENLGKDISQIPLQQNQGNTKTSRPKQTMQQ